MERTEPASPKRLEKSREDGQVPRSPELSTFAVLITAGIGLWLMGSHFAVQFSNLMREGMKIPRVIGFDSGLLGERFLDQSLHALAALAPYLLLMFLIALGAPLLLSGWLFTWKSITPDFNRVNPLKGLARIFSLHGLVELVKALLTASLIGAMSIWTVWQHKEEVLSLIGAPFAASAGHMAELVIMSFLAVAGAMALVAAIDVPFKLWDHNRKLKMTKEEVRQENKETEGDPHVKGRIRSLQREAARKRMMAAIPTADVVVTNPTHYAVALKYGETGMRAPVVVVKGSHLLALRIREIAEENHVPILEAPPLARALHKHTDLGESIPEALYTAVAEVLAYVYQLQRYEKQGGARPPEPKHLPVPAELDPQAAAA